MARTATPGSVLVNRIRVRPASLQLPMLYLINIHWNRRKPEEGRPSKGRATYPENARTLQAAKNKAIRKFNRHFGMHLAIDQVAEFQDPAGIFQS